MLSQMNPQELQQNSTFSTIQDKIPGNGVGGKMDFIGNSLDGVKGWMNGIVTANALTAQSVLIHCKGFIDFADDKLDYMAAFLDVSTNYYEHTGTQTLARRLIERALAEI